MTITTPATAFDYLTAVANGQTKAAGLKRPTLQALQQAAQALGLPDRIDYATYGYHVGHGHNVGPCSNLREVAAILLRSHKRAQAPAAPARSLAPFAADLGRSLGLSNGGRLPAARKGPELPPVRLNGRDDIKAPRFPAYVVHRQQQQQPQQAPTAPAVAPGPRARKVAPSHLPADGGRLLQRFELKLDSVLTAGLANSKIAKGKAVAHSAIYHGLPGRQLAVAIYGPDGGSVPARGRLAEVRRLALANGLGSDAQRLDACPWASDGCRDGCLVFSGRNAMGSAPAACKARRSLARLWCPQVFMIVLLWAIAKEYAYAQARGLALSLRLKGTDDLPHHLQTFNLSPSEAVTLQRRYGLPALPGQGTTLPEVLSLAMGDGTIRWYEYSKAPIGGRQGLEQMRALGIDVTASLAADRPQGARAACGAVRAGFRLAVPVALPKGAPIPAELKLAPTLGLPAPADSPEFGRMPADDKPVRLLCVDGDLTDLRWLDPQGPQPLGFDGVAVVLRTKASRGRGKASDAFSLSPAIGQWQALKGGGFALLQAPA